MEGEFALLGKENRLALVWFLNSSSEVGGTLHQSSGGK